MQPAGADPDEAAHHCLPGVAHIVHLHVQVSSPSHTLESLIRLSPHFEEEDDPRVGGWSMAKRSRAGQQEFNPPQPLVLRSHFEETCGPGVSYFTPRVHLDKCTLGHLYKGKHLYRCPSDNTARKKK